MPQLRIEGVDVFFPKDPPYPCQVDYMKQCIRSLKFGTNALLESPTGTGKTLCLLCSTLAWQYEQKNLIQKHGGSDGSGFGGGSGNSLIIYATRTHSQLAQVVSELRSTNYRPVMTVLGSREQLCVHEKISKLKGGILNHACNTMSSKRTCSYKNNLDNNTSIVGSTPSGKQSAMLDVEDLVKMGRSNGICPYFYSRDVSTKADLVLLPYNYLLDSSIRNTLKLKWENSIIIFDEAHNLERVASDAASCSISSTDIAACIKEMQQVLTIVKENVDTLAPAASAAKGAVTHGTNESTDLGPPDIKVVVVLLRALFAMEEDLQKIHLTKSGSESTSSTVLPGQWLGQWFESSGLIRALNKTYLIELRRCAMLLIAEAEKALDGFDSGIGGGGAPMAASEPKLSVLLQMFERMVQASNRSLWSDYRCYVCEEDLHGAAKWGKLSSPATATSNAKGGKKRVVNFWSFSPGIALEELKSLRVRSIILTSGTLSPLDSLKEDMKIPFTIQLENPHVIERDQIWVGAVAKGLTNNVTLNSAYSNRDSNTYKDELGQSILHICLTMCGMTKSTEFELAKLGNEVRRSLIPKGDELKGGILVFFPSYAWMDSLLDRWKVSGLLEQLRAVAGHIMVEPKGGSRKVSGDAVAKKSSNPPSFMASNMLYSKPTGGSDITGKSADGDSFDGDDEMKGLVGQFDAVIAKHGTCILFAVCRGKVSEGIDFSDSKGRVVIVTGIPFAPFNDAWVILKKQYLDDRCRESLQSSSSSSSSSSAAVPSYYLTDSNTAIAKTTGSESSGSASNIWLNAMLPSSATNRNATQTTSFHGRNTAPVKPRSTLTGQSWYAQSASRAVNQSVGRIIRHKNDWGAIFLLDDRFQNDQQRAQLSSWVKPQLQKFPQIATALSSFRDFITSCMTNPRLLSTAKADKTVGPSQPPLLVSAIRPKNQFEANIVRHVDVPEDVLGDDGDITYVNPKLLMTQPTEAANSMPTTAVRAVEKSQLKRHNSNSDQVQSNESKTVNLAGLFQRATNKPVIAPSNPKFVTSTASNQAPDNSKDTNTKNNKSIAHYFGLQKQPHLVLTAPEAKLKVQESERKGESGFSTTDGSTKKQSLERKNSRKEADAPVVPIVNSKLLQSQRSSLSQDPPAATSSIDIIKKLAVDLRAFLKPSDFIRLKDELMASKSAGIVYISQAKSFLDRLMIILADLNRTMKLDALLKLSCILPSDLVETFQSLAETACSSEAKSKSEDRKPKSTALRDISNMPSTEEDHEKPSLNTSEPSTQLAESSSASSGSKRARLMVDSCKQGPEKKRATLTSVTSLSARIEEIGKISFSSKQSDGTAASSSVTGNCGICKLAVADYCAAKCGHVCCRICWGKLLKVKSCCPFCNAEVTIEKLSVLHVVPTNKK